MPPHTFSVNVTRPMIFGSKYIRNYLATRKLTAFSQKPVDGFCKAGKGKGEWEGNNRKNDTVVGRT